MRYRLLGKSGLRVSEVALGAMTFGEDWGWGSSKEESRRVYDAFREAGGNFVDTANVYTNGTSESFLGEFLEGHRETMVVATKYTNTGPTQDPNGGGNQRKNMVQSVEASLRRLRTDYIDLYWVHVWDQITPVEEVMRGLDDLVRQGKVLYAGISDAPAWWVAQANTLAALRGWSPFIGLQIEYNLVERTVERELIPMAEAFGLGVTAWSPLAGGVLTGKYHGPDAATGRMDNDMLKDFRPDETRSQAIVAVVREISKATGRSMAQIALAWLRQRPVPVIPILGARKISQLQDNLASLDLELTGEQMRTLDQASRVDLGFPQELYRRELVRNLVYGGLRDRIVA
ncbi:MAG: aldo/keto reductase [Bryobacteraceae bacterium]|nr:aldo/keto reductase [Bryobacteraceae bacterium]